MRLAFRLRLCDFTVDASFGVIVHPLADKDLSLLVEEVGALAFALIINPLTFKVVAIAPGQLAESGLLAFEPEALVHVAVGVDHSAFAVGQVVQPIAIVAVPVHEVLCAAAVLVIVGPVSGIFFP